jgi:hypothetical protein
MRACQFRTFQLHYKLMVHALICPRIKYGASSPGTFSRREKEKKRGPG